VSDLNLEQLLSELSDEQVTEVDWNAPEAGQFPPIAPPGSYEFVFRLREDTPFDKVEIPSGSGVNHLVVVFDADVIVNGEAKTLTYQRVNTYKHEKVSMSSAAELARALNIRPASNPPTNRDWIETFQSASSRARGRAELAWRYFDKSTGVTYSTSPRKRKNPGGQKVRDTQWPRNAEGSFSDTVTASDGTKHYGQAEFTRFYTPAVVADAANA
jgi:hypothetical protein